MTPPQIRVRTPCDWLTLQRVAGTHVLGVELADEAIRLGDLPPARGTGLIPGTDQLAVPTGTTRNTGYRSAIAANASTSWCRSTGMWGRPPGTLTT